MSRACREITSLSLPECKLIDNTALDALALRLDKLRKLNICSTAITAEDLKGFINDHSKLKGAEIIINSKIIHKEVSELCESKSIELTLHKERRAPILFWSHGSIISRRGTACILNI